MKKIEYKFGLPILDFLDNSFCEEYYRKIFFATILSVKDVKKIFQKINSLKHNKETISNYLKELKKQLDIFFDFEEDGKIEINNSNLVLTKLKSWINTYEEITDNEIKEYIEYYELSHSDTFNILRRRKQEQLSSPQKIKEELDKYVIGQDNAKQVLCFSFYLHAIRIGYIKPIIHSEANLPTDINDQNLPKSNVLLIGPTGSGKSHIINSLCKIFKLPYLRIDCSSLTS